MYQEWTDGEEKEELVGARQRSQILANGRSLINMKCNICRKNHAVSLAFDVTNKPTKQIYIICLGCYYHIGDKLYGKIKGKK